MDRKFMCCTRLSNKIRKTETLYLYLYKKLYILKHQTSFVSVKQIFQNISKIDTACIKDKSPYYSMMQSLRSQ